MNDRMSYGGNEIGGSNSKLEIRAVYFDAGYNLLKTRLSLCSYAAEVARELNPEVTEDSFSSVSYLMENRFRLYFKNQAFHWSSNENIFKLWEDVYGYWMRLVGFEEAKSRYLARCLYERLGEADCWGVYPDVLETLEFLSRNGLYLGIVSNWDERLELIIEKVGLKGYFSFILSSAQVGFGKPDARLFKRAIEKSGVDKNFSLFIGDDLQADFYGALNVGMKACLIDREDKHQDFSGMKLKSLSQLKKIVKLAEE